MTLIFLVFLAIILLFILLLGVKEISGKRFCVICASISLTWIALLTLCWLDIFEDRLIIAVLLGESAIGLYYLIEEKTKEDLHIFRLPFLLTLTLAALLLIEAVQKPGSVIILLIVLWIILLFIYLYRKNKYLRGFVDKLITCCKNW